MFGETNSTLVSSSPALRGRARHANPIDRPRFCAGARSGRDLRPRPDGAHRRIRRRQIDSARRTRPRAGRSRLLRIGAPVRRSQRRHRRIRCRRQPPRRRISRTRAASTIPTRRTVACCGGSSIAKAVRARSSTARPRRRTISPNSPQRLIDIHGQNEHQSLLRRDVQLDLLDHYAGAEALAARVRDAYRTWRSAADTLHALRNQRRTVARPKNVVGVSARRAVGTRRLRGRVRRPARPLPAHVEIAGYPNTHRRRVGRARRRIRVGRGGRRTHRDVARRHRRRARGARKRARTARYRADASRRNVARVAPLSRRADDRAGRTRTDRSTPRSHHRTRAQTSACAPKCSRNVTAN